MFRKDGFLHNPGTEREKNGFVLTNNLTGGNKREVVDTVQPKKKVSTWDVVILVIGVVLFGTVVYLGYKRFQFCSRSDIVCYRRGFSYTQKVTEAPEPILNIYVYR